MYFCSDEVSCLEVDATAGTPDLAKTVNIDDINVFGKDDDYSKCWGQGHSLFCNEQCNLLAW